MEDKATTTEGNPEYLLLFRGTEWEDALSPDELQATMDKFIGWLDNLNQRGILKSARPLQPAGVSISRGEVSDGPFAESKEAVGGFFLLDVATMEEALAIARENPIVAAGGIMEVRPVAAMCPTLQRLGMSYTSATTSA
jgi:hypothetical protein